MCASMLGDGGHRQGRKEEILVQRQIQLFEKELKMHSGLQKLPSLIFFFRIELN